MFQITNVCIVTQKHGMHRIEEIKNRAYILFDYFHLEENTVMEVVEQGGRAVQRKKVCSVATMERNAWNAQDNRVTVSVVDTRIATARRRRIDSELTVRNTNSPERSEGTEEEEEQNDSLVDILNVSLNSINRFSASVVANVRVKCLLWSAKVFLPFIRGKMWHSTVITELIN